MYCCNDAKRHRDGGGPAVIWPVETVYYYSKKYLEKIEEIRTKKLEEIRIRIVNRVALRCGRYWYDKTYSDTSGEAFQARMKRDMDELENEIGYKFC